VFEGLVSKSKVLFSLSFLGEKLALVGLSQILGLIETGKLVFKKLTCLEVFHFLKTEGIQTDPKTDVHESTGTTDAYP
jgi:hypothetical protein